MPTGCIGVVNQRALSTESASRRPVLLQVARGVGIAVVILGLIAVLALIVLRVRSEPRRPDPDPSDVLLEDVGESARALHERTGDFRLVSARMLASEFR